jgi:hypothetical protein
VRSVDDERWRADLAKETSEDKVLAVFDVLGTLFSKPDFRGCSFMNAVAEGQPGSPDLLAAANFRAWDHELFEGLVHGLGMGGKSELVSQLILLYDGSVTTAQMHSTAEPAKTAKAMARLLIERSAA